MEGSPPAAGHRLRMAYEPVIAFALQNTYIRALSILHKHSILRYDMRRILLFLVIVAALAVPADALAFTSTTRSGCGSGCGTFQTSNGAGSLRASAKGSSYGNVGSGQIWVLDRTSDGKRGWTVSGYEQGPIVHSGGWREFRGSGMTFSMQSAWSLKILNARGIAVRVVADGSVTIAGSGKYSINGSAWRNWPSLSRLFGL